MPHPTENEQNVTMTQRHIRVITRRELIASVPLRWQMQYKRGATWGNVGGGSSKAIYDNLSALDTATAPREDVDAIIGNRSWTSIGCDVCGADADLAVVLCGDAWSERETTVCRDCLTASLAALGAATSR